MERGFANRSDSSRVVDIRPEISAVIDSAKHPTRVWDEPEQPDPGTIRGRAVYREAFVAPWLNADGAFGCDGVTDSRLRAGRRHDHRLAQRACGLQKSLEPRCLDAVVIAQQQFHWPMLAGIPGRQMKAFARRAEAET
jgi:hypothetical protein